VVSIGDENAGCAPAQRSGEQRITERRPFKQAISLKDKLTAFARDAHEKAALLPPGLERKDLLRKAWQAHATADLDDWLKSRGPRLPK